MHQKKDSLLIPYLLMTLPLGLQSMITSLVNTVDTLMIGQIGDLELSAIGLVNQIYFILTLMIVGMISGATIFLSQFYGKHDVEGMRMCAALASGVIYGVSAIFMIAGICFPRFLLVFFSNEEPLIVCAAGYFRVVAISYLAAGFSQVCNMVLKNIGKVYIPLYTTIVAILINIVLNYILIFGHLGFPAMGVVGAAIGTLGARIVEAVILFICLYRKHREYAPRLSDLKRVTKSFAKQFALIALPVSLSETIWSIGTSLYSIVYYQMGYEYGAAVNIAKVVEQLLCCFFKGGGQAGAIILGSYLGEGKNENAVRAAKKMAFYNVIAGLIIGIGMYGAAEQILSFYNVSNRVRETAIMMLRYMAVMMPLRGYAWLHITATLRAGGDTKTCMLIDNATVWLVGLPFAYITGFFLGMRIEIVYLCIVLDDIAKTILCALRVKSGKWIKKLT